MIQQSPHFPFFASDYLGSSKVQRMSLEEEGAYIRLLAYNWEDGFIPADVAELSRMCKTNARKMALMWERLRDCFQPLESDPDKLVNLRLELERKKQQERKARRSVAGSKGAATRWQDDDNENGNAIDLLMAKNSLPIPLPIPEKKPYGPFANVLLTDDECARLLENFGDAGSARRIQALSEYIASKGKKYKSHYATILTWERKNAPPVQNKAFKAVV